MGWLIQPMSRSAQSLFTAAGYAKDVASGLYKKDGETLSATILANAGVATDVAGANELARQMGAGGIDTKVEAMANEEYWRPRRAER